MKVYIYPKKNGIRIYSCDSNLAINKTFKNFSDLEAYLIKEYQGKAVPHYPFMAYSDYVDFLLNKVRKERVVPDEIISLLGRIDSERKLYDDALRKLNEENDDFLFATYFSNFTNNYNSDLFCALSHLMYFLGIFFSEAKIVESHEEWLKWYWNKKGYQKSFSEILLSRELLSFVMFFCTAKEREIAFFNKFRQGKNKKTRKCESVKSEQYKICFDIRDSYVHNGRFSFEHIIDDFVCNYEAAEIDRNGEKSRKTITKTETMSEIARSFQIAFKCLILEYEDLYQMILVKERLTSTG